MCIRDRGFLVVLGAAAPISGLIYVITRNLSSAIIIMGIAVVMLFVACPDYKRFIILGLIGIAGLAGIVFLIVKMSESGSVGSFRGEQMCIRDRPIIACCFSLIMIILSASLIEVK